MKHILSAIIAVTGAAALADITGSQSDRNLGFSNITTTGSGYTQSSGTAMTSFVILPSNATLAYRKMVVAQAQPDAADFFRTGVKTPALQESLNFLRAYNESHGVKTQMTDEELAAEILGATLND
jgi:hypothetical protein